MVTKRSRILLFCAGLAVILGVVGITCPSASAQPLQLPEINLQIGGEAEGPEGVTQALQILVILTVLALAPAILVMVTSFTRIIVVLAFVRNALATQQMPPNQVLIGLALFLTFFVMAPVWQDVNQNSLQPYMRGEVTQEQAFTRGMQPIREFMLKQTREKDLALFVRMSDIDRPQTYADIPNYVLIPAFTISELKTAFQIGFIIFVPFLVIDMVVSSALMSMGMLMLPPMMISLPFKVLLFILVDGWNLVINSLIMSFR
ncbi:MAG: flagellar type III secretion system pore protein FliP [Syntrophomonadaceae bacterium]|nr:flagellar type III secretion system pore protein FliP [Syntrophomonadaceae bacterium]